MPDRIKLERRKWVPDIADIADQLITDYRSAEREGDLDALSTMDSWQARRRPTATNSSWMTGWPWCRNSPAVLPGRGADRGTPVTATPSGSNPR